MTNFRDSKKQKISNLIINAIAYTIGLCVSFIMTPFLIKNLGKEIYSFYPISNSIISYMTIITSSLNSVASRFVTISILKENEEESNKYFTGSMISNLIISSILFVLMLFIIIFADKLLSIPVNATESIRMLFSFTFSSALVNIISSTYGISTFAKNRIDLRSIKELIDSILKLILFIVFYKVFKPSIVYVGIIFLILAIVNYFIQKIYKNKLMPEVKIKRKYISKKHIKEMMLSSIWVALTSVGNLMISSSAILIINKFIGASESGLVSITTTISGFLSGIICLFLGVYFPILTKKYADNDEEKFKSEIKKVQLIIGGFTCATIATLIPFLPDFYKLWVPTEDSNILSIITIIAILPSIPLSFFWVQTAVATIINKVKWPAIVTLILGGVTILVQIVLSILKVNYIIVFSVSSVTILIWTAIYFPLYLSRSLKTKKTYFYKNFLKILLISFIIFAVSYAIKSYFSINSWFKFVLIGAVAGIISLLIMFLTLFKKQIFDFLDARSKK